ncbi:MAG: hypothetical protein ABFS02_07320 [Pseudomonadota bacterium]
MTVEFHYRIPWRSHSSMPGHHLSTQTGGGFEFHGHAPLMSDPHPRNVDVHASLLDPFGQYVVRTFRQRSAIPVQIVADLSASMGFHRKMEILATFAAAAAYSAYRSGDSFGFIGCDEEIRWDLYLPQRWHKGDIPEFAERIRAFRPGGRSATALRDAAERLRRHRSLLFLVSDFHFPLTEVEALMDALDRHDIVPVVLWDRREYENLPEWGFVRLADPETGAERTLFMRPELRQAFEENFERRRGELVHLCMRYGRQPFFMCNGFEPDRLTRYFHEQ